MVNMSAYAVNSPIAHDEIVDFCREGGQVISHEGYILFWGDGALRGKTSEMSEPQEVYAVLSNAFYRVRKMPSHAKSEFQTKADALVWMIQTGGFVKEALAGNIFRFHVETGSLRRWTSGLGWHYASDSWSYAEAPFTQHEFKKKEKP